jgi:uncharacterized protein (TIGR00369 family)
MMNDMIRNLPGKPCSASRIQIAQLMQPQHANNFGHVHGGWIMKLVDEAGALAGMRHAQQRVVTVAVDQMAFHKSIRLGDLVTFTAEVSYVGRTSMEIEVHVVAENPISGLRTHTNTAYLVYVAINERGEPVPVPPLITETEEEKERLEEGKKRQAYRIAQRSNNKR